jgi:hypothetical protein
MDGRADDGLGTSIYCSSAELNTEILTNTEDDTIPPIIKKTVKPDIINCFFGERIHRST